MTNRNAISGKKHEEIFAREIQKDPNTIRQIVRAFSTSMPKKQVKIKFVGTEGQHGEKSDVFIRATGDNNFGANIKSFKNFGFNQVTRMTIDNFSRKFGMPYNFTKVIKELTIAKARNSKQNWITESYISLVVNEIKPKAFDIIRDSLIGEDLPNLFVLIKSDEGMIYIYKMDGLLAYLERSINVLITERGVISLNECFSIQKKGGNGEHERHAKDDLQHGGNNLQVKMKPAILLSRLKPITILNYDP